MKKARRINSMVDNNEAFVRLWHKADILNALMKCPLLGAKRTWTNRCLPISIYAYTA